MEPRWIETLKNAPLPPSGQLTERAIPLAGSRPTRRTLLLAGLPLVAALPAVALLLPRAPKPEVSKIAVMAYRPTTPSASPAPEHTPLPPLPALVQSFPAVQPEPAPTPKAAIISTAKQHRSVPAAPPPQKEVGELPQLQRQASTQVVALQHHSLDLQASKLSVLSTSVKPLEDRLSEVLVAEETKVERVEVERLERKLRYPLDPLPNSPQAKVEKAEVLVHADSSEILGTVAFLPATGVRELLVAIFDTNSALKGTLKVLIPANATKVEIKPTIALPGARYYQLGIRHQPKRDDSRRLIVGGYVGYGAKVEVPTPPGVSINGAQFYQSNVYKDHFVRFTAVISKQLLDRLGEYGSLTIYGAVFNDKGELLSVASAPMEYKTGQQQPDLAFGLLPENTQYHYSFVVSQGWQTR